MNCADQFSGYIFMCNGKTKVDCFRYRVFGLPASRLDVVKKIQPQMKLFLYDNQLKLLYGVYTALSHGDRGLEPFAFEGSYPAQVKFGIFKECLPLPENIFKHAIKDNYQGGPKFRTELSYEQVNYLMLLFRPLIAQPLVAPSLVSDGRYVQQGQVVRPIMYAPAIRSPHPTTYGPYDPGQDCSSYFPEPDHQQRHSRHNDIEGRGVLQTGSSAYWISVASEDRRSIPDSYGRETGFQSVTQHGSRNMTVGEPPASVQGASEFPSFASVECSESLKHLLYNSQNVPQQTPAMGSENAANVHQLGAESSFSELIRGLHKTIAASMPTHSNVPLQNAGDSHVSRNDATLPSSHAPMSTHPTSSSQVAAYSTCHQTQPYHVSTATYNMPYNGVQLQTQGGPAVVESAYPSAVVESAYPSDAYWQGVVRQEVHDPYQVNSTTHIWSSGNDQTQTGGSITYGTHQAYAPMPTQELGAAYGMTQYASSNEVAPSSMPYGAQNQAYYGQY